MRWCVCVGVFILLYHLIQAKPIKKPKQKTHLPELVREKRSELDEEEEEGGTNEIQKFILDLSAKEDMRRLKERFKTKRTRDIENNVEYRRLKRFSIHERDDQEKTSPSGTVTMEMRSSRTAREDEDVTSPNQSSSTEATTNPSSYDAMPSSYDVIPSSDDVMPSSEWGSTPKQKRSNLILTHALSQWRANMRDTTPAGNSGSRATHDDSEKHSSKKHLTQSHHAKDTPQIPDSVLSTKRNVDTSENGNESYKNIEDNGLGEDAAGGLSAGPPINYHLAGGSWEIIHHNPKTRSLPSLMSGNTTMHSEYLRDDVVDDVDEYKRVEKSRRKPRLSKIRIIRSIEPEYEIQDISAVYNGRTESSDEESAHVIALNKKPIKSDGYIGCYVDKHPNRDLIKAFSISDLTPDSCRSVCKRKGHTYAGVQYGYLCHCGDDYGKHGTAEDDECNSACQGDEGKKCGGFWRNSIYVADTFNKDEDDDNDERDSRSHIDRIIPIPEQNEEVPVRQEITAYLRAYIPERPDEVPHMQIVGHAEAPHARPNAIETGSKRKEIPMATSQKSNDDKISYLHPQNIHRSFIPSHIVLKTLNPTPGKKIYTGVVKLKQNWHDDLKDRESPKTLILAGNIESAFREMFATDHDFEKAEVLGFRETSITNNLSTVHKVLVEFALTFEKAGTGKDKKLREMVENNSRLDDMPVFGNTIEVEEYKEKEDGTGNADTEVPKDTREISNENQIEDRQNGVDAFLEEVFRQIK